MATVMQTPWSDELVKRLNEDQHSNGIHPYTCGNCRDKLGIYYARNKKTGVERHIGILGKPTEDEETVIHDRELVATKDGWICPTCDYKQDWCLNPIECWVRAEDLK
jgi:hypothetical protein